MSSNSGSREGQAGLCLGPNELKFFLQGLHSDILKDVDSKLIRAIDGLLMELEHRQKKIQNGHPEKQKPKQLEAKPAELPPKEFECRNSTLTDLWEVTHLGSIYNFCLSLVVLVYLNIVLLYYIDYDRLILHLSTIAWTFSKFHIVTLVWFGMMGSILLILYPSFRFWASSRPFSRKVGLYDFLFLTLFVAFQFGLLIIPGQIVIQYDVPIVSSFIILAEQTRLMMKCHAFVRENTTKALKYKPHQDGDEKNGTKPYPDPGTLLYFLFAPTLVYRDSYPRTPYVRWGLVTKYFLQVFGCIFGGYIPIMLFVVDTFKNFGKEPLPLVHFVGVLAVSVFAGGFLMLLVFYGMFHCWLNAFAEMLRFGDRMFYQDWWNCTSFAKYYRSWNMVVYDWLYSYIYRDMYSLLGRSRVGAMMVVFLVSGFIHEYILALCFKFAFPLLFILFLSFGVILVFITRKRTSAAWNVFLWASMFQGWGLLTVFYSAEWFARMNCPRTLDPWLDFIVPRSFACNLISQPS